MSNPYPPRPPGQPPAQKPVQRPMVQTQPMAGGGGGLPHVFRPLFESTFFLRTLGWLNIIYGAIACLTVFGLIYGWAFIWAGISLNNASDALQNASRSGNPHEYQRAVSNIATFFKIIGVFALIMLSILVLVLLVFFAMFLFALAAGAGAAGGMAS